MDWDALDRQRADDAPAEALRHMQAGLDAVSARDASRPEADICPTCGAYWQCEHRTEAAADYVFTAPDGSTFSYGGGSNAAVWGNQAADPNAGGFIVPPDYVRALLDDLDKAMMKADGGPQPVGIFSSPPPPTDGDLRRLLAELEDLADRIHLGLAPAIVAATSAVIAWGVINGIILDEYVHIKKEHKEVFHDHYVEIWPSIRPTREARSPVPPTKSPPRVRSPPA